MGASRIGDLLQVGIDVLRTAVSTKTKKIVAQIGSVVGQTAETDNVEWWQHVGFASRPANPEAGKESAQAIVLRQGGREAAFASQDLRGLDIYGNLSPGETCLYATGADGTAQARVLLKANGSINLYTVEGNAAGGASMGVFIHPDGKIQCVAPNGNALILDDDGSVKAFNGSGGIQIKANGDVIISGGSTVGISGGGITLGGGPLTDFVAHATSSVAAIAALQTQVTALQTEIAAVNAALVAVCNIPPLLPAHAAAAAAGTAAVAVGAAAVTAGAATVTAQTALIPCTRTKAD